MTNIVLKKINELILDGAIPSPVSVTYIPVKDEYFQPYTGIVLIDDTKSGITPGQKLRFVSEHGVDFIFDFDDKSRSFRNEYGDWGHTAFFTKGSKV